VSLIIDASLTMTWYFEDEATKASKDLLDTVARDGAMAPPLWRIEVANAFQSGIRRKRIDAAYRDASLADLGRLPISIDADTDAHVWTTTLRLSDRYALTIYDACYLELAQRRNLPLATLDQALRAAAQALGLPLLGA
jgi:predicted nucleic acid-binding protein